MRVEDFRWNEPGYALVCAASREESAAFAGAYLRRNADVAGGILHCISNYKTGFLRKKMTILELLVDQRPKGERAAFKQKLEQNLAAAGLEGFKYRQPNSMGSETLFRWSCLYAALTGAKKFLVQDVGSSQSSQTTAQLVEWLQANCTNCSVVWVSAADDQDSMTRSIFSRGLSHLDRSRKFWHLQGGSLSEMDMEAMLARHQANLEEERRRQEEAREAARKTAWATKIQEACRLADEGKYREALDLCEQVVAEGGSLPELNVEALMENCRVELEEARRRRKEALEAAWVVQLEEANRLADVGEYGKALDLCDMMVSDGSREAGILAGAIWKILGENTHIKSRAEEIAGRSDAPSVLNMLAKHVYAEVENYDAEQEQDKDKEQDIIRKLHKAADLYSKSAWLGDVEDCYCAAKLHLSYAYTRTRRHRSKDGGVVEMVSRYTEKDAIPYIKQLLAMQENGKDVFMELSVLSMINAEICDLARSQYTEEKQK